MTSPRPGGEGRAEREDFLRAEREGDSPPGALSFPEPPDRIMAVDDLPANLRLLDAMLRTLGYSVFAFPRGDLFLRAAASNPPDLVLLDVDMPEMDGYQVCARMREEPRLRDVPVIFLSALADSQNKVRASRPEGWTT